MIVWRDCVVPVAMELGTFDVDGGHVCIRYDNAAGILAGVEFAAHGEAGFGCADPRRAPDRHLGLPRDIEWRPTRANRLYANTGIVDCIEPAVVGHPVLGPQPAHQGDTFVEPRHPL